MPSSQLLDQYGNPIQLDALTEEIAAPSLTGVRQPWGYGSMADGLTPTRLADILASANEGNHHDYLTLAEEMEEREPHYGSVLGTRKRGVSGLNVEVEAASDDAQNIKFAEEIRQLVRAPEFGELIDDLLDALGKGYAVDEIIWDRSERQWQPSRYEFRDPRFFTFDREDGRTLLLVDSEAPAAGLPLEPYKFIVHYPRLKTGLAVRGGLARLVAVSYMCKSYTLSDWMAFAEVYGQPIRVGKYGSSATEKDKQILKTAVANIGSDAAAILPESMQLEFIEAVRGSSGGDVMFAKLAEWLDKQTSKAVVGQTASAEGTPGKLGNEDAQSDVRNDLKIADAKALQNTINRHLIRPYIDLNHGPQSQYPRVEIPVPEPEDLDLLANALEKLVPLGINAPAKWARDKFAIPDPKDDDELLGAAPTAAEAPAVQPAANRACPSCGGHHVATNRMDPATDDWLNSSAALEDWEAQITEIVDPIQRLADESADEQEFLARLPELLDEIEPRELTKRLALETFKARGVGNG